MVNHCNRKKGPAKKINNPPPLPTCTPARPGATPSTTTTNRREGRFGDVAGGGVGVVGGTRCEARRRKEGGGACYRVGIEKFMILYI